MTHLGGTPEFRKGSLHTGGEVKDRDLRLNGRDRANREWGMVILPMIPGCCCLDAKSYLKLFATPLDCNPWAPLSGISKQEY